MTDHDLSTPGSGWLGRLSNRHLAIAILFAGLFLIFVGGAIAGFTAALLERDGPVRPLAWVALAAFIASFAMLGTLLWQLVRSWKKSGMSAYDRRYFRMWAIVLALGAPIGVGFAMMEDFADPASWGDQVISNGPIAPGLAIGFAAFAIILFAVATVLYHRTIDDHEERAYLWASTLSFYFIAAALPVAWLLARGGLIEPIGAATAFIILFLSILIQTLAWMWFKFR